MLKSVLFTGLIICLAFNLGANSSKAQESAKVGFTCGPCGCKEDGVVHSEAGPCPVCNMAMVPINSVEVNPEIETVNEETGSFACPPCGCGADEKLFAEAGQCPNCGMTLTEIERAVTQITEVPGFERSERLTAVILIYNGVQIIDFTAPYEVFGQSNFKVYLVSETEGPVRTAMGMIVTPHYTLANAPDADVILIPGGTHQVTANSKAVQQWLRKASQTARNIMSVCTGAFILNEAGLLDGLNATTLYTALGELAAQAPNTNVVGNSQYVDNGKIITTAGLSAGLDGTLRLISQIRGKATAQRVALHMEYDWDDDVEFSRADLLDRKLVNARIVSGRHYPLMDAPGTKWKLLSSEGDRESWEFHWEISGGGSVVSLMQLFTTKLETDGGWKKSSETLNGTHAQTSWEYTDKDNQYWHGVLLIKSNGKSIDANLRVEVERR